MKPAGIAHALSACREKETKGTMMKKDAEMQQMQQVKINDMFEYMNDVLNKENLMTEETFDALALLTSELKRSLCGDGTVLVRACQLSGFFLCIYNTLIDRRAMTDSAIQAINVLSRALQVKIRDTATGCVVTYVDGSRVKFTTPPWVGHC